MYRITRRDEQILLSIWELKDEAYLVAIRKSIARVMGEELTVGAVHIPLTRLEKAGIIESYFGDSSPKRGGRRKRIYKMTEMGIEALSSFKKKHDRLWANFNEAFSI